MITIRSIEISEIQKIEEIDRSEHVTLSYRFQEGVLEVDKVDWQVPGWTESGLDEFNITGRMKDLQGKIERGHKVIGAFEEDRLVGFAVLYEKLTDDMAQLTDLITSRKYRRRGVASKLVSEVIKLAMASNAKRLYVSATPSESAVGFYLKHGFSPTEDVHPELFELEPEDIHMILSL